MANPNAPFGLQVLQTEGKECRARVYNKTTGTALYPGDALTLISAGTVSISAAGDVLIGVAAEYKASAATSILVYDDPDAVFAVQASVDWQLADVGTTANIVANAADTTLKHSKHTLDTSSVNTTSTRQFKIIGLLIKGSNAVGSYAMIRCKPNHHFFHADVVGI